MNPLVQTFACPKCGELNSGTELQVHRGLKCAGCGTGYIPVKIEARAWHQKESPWPIVILGVFVLVLVMLFLPVWLDLWLVPILLLAGILITLLRKK